MTMTFSLQELEQLIMLRAKASPDESWTAKLVSQGPERVAKKFGEEAIEAVIAGVAGERGAIIAESADMLYHLMVLLHVRGVAIADVLGELQRRTAQSGIAEKAARPT